MNELDLIDIISIRYDEWLQDSYYPTYSEYDSGADREAFVINVTDDIEQEFGDKFNDFNIKSYVDSYIDKYEQDMQEMIALSYYEG